MHSVVRVPTQQLTVDRLDARYNAPAAVAVRQQIESCGVPVEEMGRLFESLVCGPFGSTLTADQHSETGEVLLVQPTNISEFLFDDSTSWRISRATLAASDLQTYDPGTMLFARVGVYPHVGVLPAHVGAATISSSMIAGTRSGAIDHSYLQAFLRSRCGQTLLHAAQKVTAQPTIGTYEIASTRVPVPSKDVQRYIGEKVRQAERLSARARSLVRSARLVVDALLERRIEEQALVSLLESRPSEAEIRRLAGAMRDRPRLTSIDAHRETKHTNRIAPDAITTLWTASSYRPEITDAIAHLRTARWATLGELCSERIFQGRTPTYSTNGTGYPCLKTRHVSDLFVNESDPDLVTLECAKELARFRVAPQTILMNRSGAGSVGRSAVYLSNGSPLTNEHLLHIRVGDPNDACFLALVLSSWWGERAIEQGITGSTGQLNLANEHVSRIPIPIVQSPVQRQVGDLVRRAAACASYAHALAGSAKLLADYLIECRIAEANFVAAQKALEAGDRIVDRALLRALRCGDTPNAPPLFTDLDGLYALLDDEHLSGGSD